MELTGLEIKNDKAVKKFSIKNSNCFQYYDKERSAFPDYFLFQLAYCWFVDICVNVFNLKNLILYNIFRPVQIEHRQTYGEIDR